MDDLKEKYLKLVDDWKEEYKRYTSETLTTDAFADILKVDASHFRRMISKPYKISEKMYEDLLMRFLVWQIATIKRFISGRQLNLLPAEDVLRKVTFDIRADQVKLDAIKQRKSGSLEKPDLQLTSQLRNEINVLKASLLRLSDLVPSAQEESLDQEVTYGGRPLDKTRKAGKL
jgi:hypothetical protein